MRNNSKITTLEAKFPLLSIEQGCMVSKDADITVAFRVELPELFTVTSAEYEAMHSAWHKAIKVLPNYTIVHKQDWFIKENYQAKMNSQQGSGLSFLAKSSERHFNERPYLHHSVYLFLTKTNKQRMQRQSNFSSLCRGHLLPKEITDKEEVIKFMEAVWWVQPSKVDYWTDTSPFQKTDTLLWRTSAWVPTLCVSGTTAFACIRCQTRTICPQVFPPTHAMSDYRPTEATADCPLPLPPA